MKRLVDLRVLFVVVALLEFAYFLASMMPPRYVTPLTGWVLNADGQWLVKLLGVALLTQAYIAWIFRRAPTQAIARALAFYQFASATIDWVMWIAMRQDGIFSTPLARITVVGAIVSHYVIGILLLIAISTGGQPKPLATTALHGGA